MEQQRIIQIPTAANMAAAWDEYSDLVKRYYAEPDIWQDVVFVNDLARSLRRYMTLFNAMDGESR